MMRSRGATRARKARNISRPGIVGVPLSADFQIDAHGHTRGTGWHLLGTARMGNDPEKSVVNNWGRSYDVKNLFIIDGSIFVTAGAVNPTTTIQALSLYIAENMKKNLANLFD